MRYPNYPRDASGHIPEPQCFDCLKVMADLFASGLWDMNGASICVSSVTGKAESLDDEFEAWQDRFDSVPLDDNHDLIWQSTEQEVFDRDGAALAGKLYEFFGGSRTIYHRSTTGVETWIEAVNAPHHHGVSS
jgi:hypothetical protein